MGWIEAICRIQNLVWAGSIRCPFIECFTVSISSVLGIQCLPRVENMHEILKIALIGSLDPRNGSTWSGIIPKTKNLPLFLGTECRKFL